MNCSEFRKLFSCVVGVLPLWLLWFGGSAMAASESGSSSRELDQTPTWAVAVVCTVFILISIALEKSLHKVGTWLGKKQKKALLEALEKVKAELMILGFISLLLTFGQSYIVKICVPEKLADKMLPCPYKYKDAEKASDDGEKHRRKLLSYERRYLAADTTSFKCSNEGHEPLLSVNGLHQLHILIFFLAVFHVLYSAITMLLGRLKIRGWKAWEAETSTNNFEFANAASRFRLTHETSFVRAHADLWTRIPIFFYIVGPVLWASVVVYLLVNVNAAIPVVIILAVGTKLQAILAKMAIEITDRHAVVQGIPLVQGSDKYFWFGQPQLVLHLIHFALFQNAFQVTYILWIWYSFGVRNCFRNDYKLAIMKVALGIVMLFLCSYITLPLYALVTQMGSRMKKAIFDEQTNKALRNWHMAVKKKQRVVKLGKFNAESVDGSPAASTSAVHPSGPTLHRFKTTGHSTRSQSYEDQDHEYESDVELSPELSQTASFIVRMDHADHQQLQEHEHEHSDEETNSSEEAEFSFKPSDLVEKPPHSL
ncbi:MLO-like protein [Vigna angularis]|uniref:MLO-like protein n=1 Tax=Phaseolus angularis TaxID=3914 RepID=A0A8T0JN09_PHAAN|nr:MLO-like protein [Vigna angularis]